MDAVPKTPSDAVPGRWRRLAATARSRVRAAAPFAAGVASALVALLIYSALNPGPQPLTLRQVNDAVGAAMASATAPPPFSADVYRAIAPSLVLIEATGGMLLADDQERLGTGVVVDANGAILTALHVVAHADAIAVTFADGTHTTAVLAAAEPENDIAVLSPTQLPGVLVPATIGNPNALRVGDEAFAVGHPLGLYGSLSAGVISSLNRAFQPVASEHVLAGLIQFDAAVNPGNSGGPLLNRAGQVVGIVVGLMNPTDQDVFVGIGFAVPIDVAGRPAGMPQY